MAKADYTRYILPDIEMYAGNTDTWDVQLFTPNMRQFDFSELEGYTYRLIIKDYGYTHRSNGPTYFTLVKTGTLIRDDNGVGAVAHFEFTKADTNDRYGKYTYQIEIEGRGEYASAQGNLFIFKNINHS